MNTNDEVNARLYPDSQAAASEQKRTTRNEARLDTVVPPGATPSIVQPAPWPVMEEAAYHGLTGEVVRLIAPHTEADPVSLSASFLSEFGTMLNRGPHLILDGSYHPLLVWPVLVGQSSKSRKGSAGNRIKTLFKTAAPEWTRGECRGTLSSGEGLTAAVRDPEYREVQLKGKDRRPTGETVQELVDAGVEDKRLFLVQSEFGTVLKVMGRDGNSLSGVLRDAWDGQDLAPMTKGNPIKATEPHIGLVGHVTKDELLRNLSETEASNGLGNRFLWLLVRRSKELPFSSSPEAQDIEDLASRLGKALTKGRTIGKIGMTLEARNAWAADYHDLSADRPGLAGALLGRAEAYTMRLAALYAVLDGQRDIDLVHLQAARAFWNYVETSTMLIFGDALGDPLADTILAALRTRGSLSDTEISNLFSRHTDMQRLGQAKTRLLSLGLAHFDTLETTGRPKVTWKMGAKKAN